MECKLEIWLTPHSAKRRIECDERGIRVYVNSPPVDGKANEECCALFSEKLRIPKSMVSIARGTKGRKKVILIKGMTHEKVLHLLRESNEK